MPASPATTPQTAAQVIEKKGAAPDAVEQSIERAAEQVFLSPRVVDQRSFDELAGTLQRVVREAAAQGKGLATTGEQVRALTDQLRALMRELQQRTDAATKVLPLMEAQGKRVQELTGRVTHEAAMTRAREARDAVVKAMDEDRARLVASAREQAAAEVRDAVRAVVREEVERARAGVAESLEAHAAEAERRTEAAATEVSEQITALRADAARIVADARARLYEGGPAPQRQGPDADGVEQRIHAASAAARASVAASVEDALARAGAAVRELQDAVGSGAAGAEGLRSLVARGEGLVRELGERAEASARGERGGAGPSPQAVTAELQRATLHAQQVGAWLVQLLGAADQMGRGLDGLVRAAAAAAAATKDPA